MLNDPKSTFRYVPACATDIRKTFKRVKKALADAQPNPPPPEPPPEPAKADLTHVVQMRKRGAS